VKILDGQTFNYGSTLSKYSIKALVREADAPLLAPVSLPVLPSSA
jgi:hypothetical protein